MILTVPTDLPTRFIYLTHITLPNRWLPCYNLSRAVETSCLVTVSQFNFPGVQLMSIKIITNFCMPWHWSNRYNWNSINIVHWNLITSEISAVWLNPGVCITTTIWRCRQPFSQWQRCFHMKTALPLAKRLVTVSVTVEMTQNPRTVRDLGFMSS